MIDYIIVVDPIPGESIMDSYNLIHFLSLLSGRSNYLRNYHVNWRYVCASASFGLDAFAIE